MSVLNNFQYKQGLFILTLPRREEKKLQEQLMVAKFINTSYYLVVLIRKINSLCFTTNVFLSNSYRTQGCSFVCIYYFRSSQQSYSFFEKNVLKNFAKFLRTPFYITRPSNCFFLLLSSDNLITGQQKIDFCYIKTSFQIYDISFF